MRKITEIFVTVCEIPNSEMNELCARAGDGFDDFYVTKGFDDVKECYEYAELLAKAIGLSADCVYGDVNDLPKLILVK